MKKIDLGQTIGILANIGVIAGIAFLGIEIRQNNQFLRSEAIGTALETRMVYNDQISTNPEYAALQMRNVSQEDLTEEDLFRLEAGLASVKMGWQKDYVLFREGILPEEYLRANLPVMRAAFRRQDQAISHGDHWENNWKDVAAPSFRRFVEECILLDCEDIPR